MSNAKNAEQFLAAVAKSALPGLLAILSGQSEQDAFDATIERLASEKAKVKHPNLRDDE